MDNWIDEFARTLGEAPLTSTEMSRLLDAAGDVAHRVERKMTPLSTFVVGCAVGRTLATGCSAPKRSTTRWAGLTHCCRQRRPTTRRRGRRHAGMDVAVVGRSPNG